MKRKPDSASPMTTRSNNDERLMLYQTNDNRDGDDLKGILSRKTNDNQEHVTLMVMLTKE